MTMVPNHIFTPGKHAGLAYIGDRPQVLTRTKSARIRQYAASDFPEVEAKIKSRFEPKWKPGSDPCAFEIASVPVLMERAEFGRHGVQLRDRWLLSGAKGDEALTRYVKQVGGLAVQEKLVQALMPSDKFHPIQVKSPRNQNLPFAIAIRNARNYYHFLTEAMPQLAIIARMDSTAPIFVHLPKLSTMKPFAMDFIQALYPALAERITFTDATVYYDKVLSIYNHKHYLYQTQDPAVMAMLQDIPEDDAWHHINGARSSRAYVSRSTVDSGLKLLRKDALALLQGMDIAALPKHIFIGREHGPTDRGFRESPGQDTLVEALQGLGFQEVFMERLSPIQQIATFYAADRIVAPHGAGLANMIFARRSAAVVEIGNSQTQLHRWGDFNQNAHVSRCRYSTVFADVNTDDPRIIPPITDGLLGPRIGKRAVERVISLVD